MINGNVSRYVQFAAVYMALAFDIMHLCNVDFFKFLSIPLKKIIVFNLLWIN